MRRLTLAAALVLALASSAWGDLTRDTVRSVVPVKANICPTGACPRGVSSVSNLGSGVVIGKAKDGRLVVLSAGHCFAGFTRGRDTAEVGVAGRYVSAHVVGAVWHGQSATWDQPDLAVLTIPYTEDVAYSPLADALPTSGELTAIGFPAHGAMVKKRGSLIGCVGKFLHSKAALNSGGSGGPVFNESGEVVAVHTHTGVRPDKRADLDDGYATTCVVARKLLGDWLGYVPGDSAETPAPSPAPGGDQPGPPPGPPPSSTPNADRALLEEIRLIRSELGTYAREGQQADHQLAAAIEAAKQQAAADNGTLAGWIESNQQKTQQQIDALKSTVNGLRPQPIRVEIRDPSTGKVTGRDFQPGEPIRLQLPTVPNAQ